MVYQTIAAETDEKKLAGIKEKFRWEKIAAVCFFSPTGVVGFLRKFEEFLQGKVKIAAIGRTTAQCVKENNLRADFVSAKPAANDFADEFVNFLRNLN
jgi:uroporphyrinogen-III synthase